ncbi:hypothetical protein [Streptomyces sp. NBC_01477]|uniref:hypothetical protein n=1 Tax=Streptomyces sp. NBC_01477 TaxID=2976015 RepID=UPI002E3410F4|nr:hypothetical protein [Streptomyces sp. NBC_01477]
MLKFTLSTAAIGQDAAEWEWNGWAWRSGDDEIMPYLHPALHPSMITDGAETVVVVRELGRGEPAAVPGKPARVTPDRLRQTLAGHDGQHLDRTVLHIRAGALTVRAGTWAVAPVYLAGDERALTGSWDPADLRGAIRAATLLDREVARLLSRRHRYGHDTVWSTVHRLTERSVASWSGGTPSLRYPAAALHAQPRPLRQGADVLSAFEAVLTAAVRRRAESAHGAVELSGGLDSANVAAGLTASQSAPVTPAALLIGGSVDQQQRRRRGMMIDSFGLGTDVTVAVADFMPFGPTGTVGEPLPTTPYSEPWIEAKQAMMSALAGLGAHVSYGGTGGDELCSLRSAEQAAAPSKALPDPVWLGPRVAAAVPCSEQRIAPAGILHASSLLAFASRAPQFLRNGLWPVSPMCDPEVIRFCESLPRPWRENKTVQRLRLARLGLPLETYSEPRDDPREALSTAIRVYVVPYLRRLLRSGGILIDSGYVAADGLTRMLDTIERLGNFRQIDRSLFLIASVERGLRACAGIGEIPRTGQPPARTRADRAETEAAHGIES